MLGTVALSAAAVELYAAATTALLAPPLLLLLLYLAADIMLMTIARLAKPQTVPASSITIPVLMRQVLTASATIIAMMKITTNKTFYIKSEQRESREREE